MRNIITNGPLEAPPINDAPNTSNLDSIFDATTAQSIDGYTSRLRYPQSEFDNAGTGAKAWGKE